MLRATTDPMVNVFCGLIGLAAVLAFVKGRMSFAIKAGVAVAALVAIALLKTFDAKFWGVVVMGGAVMILFVLPWLDHSPVKSIRYRPGWHKYVYAVFVVVFLILGWLGVEPVSDNKTLMAQIGTVYYFGFFLLMPWWSRLGEFKPVPERVVFQAH
jgi:ubiquinol-cytochrome c reductase cytochrome b subunit